MKKFTFTIIFILIFCFTVLAQTQSNSNCPTISVTGPSTALELEEPMTFTANVSGIDLTKIEYEWSVESGVIVEGQGTKTIKVVTNMADSTPTATVEIKGLAEGCPNTDSETAIIICYLSPRLFDEFKVSAKPTDVKMLDALILELENDPTATISIIIYHKGKFRSETVKKKEAFIKKYLADKKIADDKVSIINSAEDETDRIRIFIVPPGAELPTP